MSKNKITAEQMALAYISLSGETYSPHDPYSHMTFAGDLEYHTRKFEEILSGSYATESADKPSRFEKK